MLNTDKRQKMVNAQKTMNYKYSLKVFEGYHLFSVYSYIFFSSPLAPGKVDLLTSFFLMFLPNTMQNSDSFLNGNLS